MMLVFQAVEITPALLCHRYIDACAVVSDKMFSYKLHFLLPGNCERESESESESESERGE